MDNSGLENRLLDFWAFRGGVMAYFVDLFQVLATFEFTAFV
jgi:hypothetical protein